MTTPNPFAAPEPGPARDGGAAAATPGYGRPEPGQPPYGPPPATPPGYGQPPYGPPTTPPGYGQPPSYGQLPPPAYGYGASPFGVAPASTTTNGYAIASLVCGIAGFFLLLPSVLAVVFGHLAKSQIRQRGEQGEGLATAGLITGYLGLAFLALLFLLLLVGVLGAATY